MCNIIFLKINVEYFLVIGGSNVYINWFKYRVLVSIYVLSVELVDTGYISRTLCRGASYYRRFKVTVTSYQFVN